MDFKYYVGKAGACKAAEITDNHMRYLQEEGHLRYSIGFIEFRAIQRPAPGDMVVYQSGQEAFVMKKEKFKEQYL